MTKEALSELILAGLGSPKLSDRSISDYIDNWVMPNLPKEESEVAAFLKPHITTLKSLDGQVRNEVSSHIKSLEDSKPKDEKPKDDKPKDEKPKNHTELSAEEIQRRLDESDRLAREANEAISALNAEKAKKEALETRDALFESALKISKSKGSIDDALLGIAKDYVFVSYKDGDTAESLAENITAKYDTLYTQFNGRGYQPIKSSSSPQSADHSNFFKKMEEEGQYLRKGVSN